MTTRTVAVDGLNVETTESGAVALQKVLAERDEARAKLAAADAKAVTDAEKHAAELAAKDALINEAKAQVPDAAKLEQMARDHAALCTKAKAIKSDIEVAAKDADTIRKEVVVAKLGDVAKDYSRDQFRTAFDVMAAGIDPAALASGTAADAVVPSGTQTIAQPKDGELSARDKQLRDGWKNRPGVAA